MRVAAILGVLAGCASWHEAGRDYLKIGPRPFQFDAGVRVTRLHNGLLVALAPDDSASVVTVEVRYTTGAADDPPGRSGLASLVARTLMDAARPETGGPTIGEMLVASALTADVETTHSALRFSETALPGSLDAVLGVEARRLATTCDQIDDASFTAVRDGLVAEPRPRDDTAHDVSAAIWGPDHPYTRALGAPEIGDATRDEACRFLDAAYGTNRTVIAVAGRFDPEAALKTIQADFDPIRRAATQRHASIPAPTLDGSVVTIDGTPGSARVVVALAAPGDSAREVALGSEALAAVSNEIEREGRGERWLGDVQYRTIGDGRRRAGQIEVEVRGASHLDEAAALIGNAIDRVSHWGTEVWNRPRTLGVFSQFDHLQKRAEWLAGSLVDGSHADPMALAHELDAFDPHDVPKWVDGHWGAGSRRTVLIRPRAEQIRDTRVRAYREIQPTRHWAMSVDPAEAGRAIDLGDRHSLTVDTFALDNGLRVALAPAPRSSLVFTSLVFPTGQATAPALVAATAAFDLVDDRLDNLPPDDRQRVVWAKTLGTDVWQTARGTTTTINAEGFGVFADWHLWQLWRRAGTGGYRTEMSSGRNPDLAYWHAHPTAERRMLDRVLGDVVDFFPPSTEENFDARPRRDAVEDYRHAHFRAHGATLLIAGAFDAKTIEREARDLFGSWGADPPPPPSRTAHHAPDGGAWIAVEQPDAVTLTVAIGFAATDEVPTDHAPELVLQAMLDERLAAIPEPIADEPIDTLAGWARVIECDLDRDHAAEDLTALLGALVDLRDHAGDDATGFARARRRALAAVLTADGGAEPMTGQLDDLVRHGLPLDTDLAAEIAKVTPAEVAAVAAKTLAADRMTVGLDGRAADLDAALASVPHSETERH